MDNLSNSRCKCVKALIFVLGVAFSGTAQAINLQASEQVPVSELPQQVCELSHPDVPPKHDWPLVIESGLESNPRAYCTAEIIGRRKLVTAAHCLNRQKGKLLVRCPGGVEREAILSTFRLHPDFDRDSGSLSFSAQRGDIATFEVGLDFEIDPLRFPKDSAELSTLMERSDLCRVFGFGLFTTDTGIRTLGLLHGVMVNKPMIGASYEVHDGYLKDMQDFMSSLPESAFKDIEKLVSMQIQRSRGFWDQVQTDFGQPEFVIYGDASLVDSGDSGGALLCRSSTGEEVLVAVNQSMSGGLVSFHSNVLFFRDWIQQDQK